jgi:hypothetical protein
MVRIALNPDLCPKVQTLIYTLKPKPCTENRTNTMPCVATQRMLITDTAGEWLGHSTLNPKP